MTHIRKFIFIPLFMGLTAIPAIAAEHIATMRVDDQHVSTWNRFANSVHKLHRHLLSQHEITTREHNGGYGGYTGPRDYYHEVHYFDKNSGRLLSKVRWIKDKPEVVHTMEVYIHDKSGNLLRDYTVAWLPGSRNAPVQTLINLHNDNGELHAFRQFDASGERIYEQCREKGDNGDIIISLEDYELMSYTSNYRHPDMKTKVYAKCFNGVAKSVGKYINPLSEISSGQDDFALLTR
jgi:hypothetical protein